MRRPVVAIATLGGTITMTSTDGPDQVTPSLTAEQLLRSVPGLADLAQVRAETLCTKPGASLGFRDVLGALHWAHRAVADGAAGVVLVQGTDTLEETSYLLDLHWQLPEPLVFTGAMRPPQHPGADGPANLQSAVVAAVAPESRGRGVLVVLNDDVHAAARVRKTDSTRPDAFSSAPFGPLGRVRERVVGYAGWTSRLDPLPEVLPGRNPRVALLESTLGEEGELLELIADADYDGAILAAFGAGHVSSATATAVSKVCARIPVVLASRTGAGPVLNNTYGFPGSEADLLGRGVISAGWLDGRKSRLLLWSQLAADASIEVIREGFRVRGRSGQPTPDSGH